MSTPAVAEVQGQVEMLARRLRLPYLRKAAPELLATARSQRWDPAEAIRMLLEEEASGRSRASVAIRLERACFPSGKTFDSWNEKASSIPAPSQSALRTLEWVGRHENLCVCGPSGTGKSHFLEALGRHAVEQGLKVTWLTLESLGDLVGRHRADGTVAKAIQRIVRVDLILIDDIGLLPVPVDAAEALFRLVDAAYERRSIAIASNLHPSGFDQLMPKTLATATVDRLLHHCHLLLTRGDSFRLGEATGGKGVKPLN